MVYVHMRHLMTRYNEQQMWTSAMHKVKEPTSRKASWWGTELIFYFVAKNI